MSEEFENNECCCNEEEKKHECGCTCKEKLQALSAVANIITTGLVAAIACSMFFDIPTVQKVEKAPKVQKAKSADQHLFNKKGMSMEDALKNGKTTVVLFYADWCPHCHNFAPTFKELEKDRTLKKNFNFVRLNSEDAASAKYMEEYQIQGFPSLFMVNTKTGEKQQIENYLLFGDNAKETLKDLFNEFAQK